MWVNNVEERVHSGIRAAANFVVRRDCQSAGQRKARTPDYNRATAQMDDCGARLRPLGDFVWRFQTLTKRVFKVTAVTPVFRPQRL